MVEAKRLSVSFAIESEDVIALPQAGLLVGSTPCVTDLQHAQSKFS